MDNNPIFSILDSESKILPNVLGNKGANLVDIHRLGVPVPDGFILTTAVWEAYRNDSLEQDDDFWNEIYEKITGFTNSEEFPLVSVRSGSTFSMPGMMTTLLNVGLTSSNLDKYIAYLGERTTLDCYRRLLETFAISVFQIDEDDVFASLDNYIKENGLKSHINLSVEHLRELIILREELIETSGFKVPDTPQEQLRIAILTVLKSWDRPGAEEYRRIHGIPVEAGTGVVIQKMVFGNLNNQSATGVFFTRNPITGLNEPFGEVLFNAQGEDVVSGHFHPVPLNTLVGGELDESYKDLLRYGQLLEKHYHHPQDIEFTVQDGKIYILQTRNAKLTAKAAFRIASDLLTEGRISIGEAIRIIQPSHAHDLTSNQIDWTSVDSKTQIVSGIAASTGVASGEIVFSLTKLKELSRKGIPGILVDDHIDPNDIRTLFLSAGVITTKGGSASHMAIVMRAASKPGIVGTQAIKISEGKKSLVVEGNTYREGDPISIDGGTGQIIFQQVSISEAPTLEPYEKEILMLRENQLGNSPWSAACYKVPRKHQRARLAGEIKELVKKSKWRSPKAKVIEILNILLPADQFIISKIFSPKDKDQIKEALIEVIESGKDNAPRTTFYPEKLSGAPWAYGPNNKEEIDQFMNGKWDGKYGGLNEWLQQNPEAIIISQEPVGKMDSKLAKEHFVFTSSLIAGNPHKLVISIDPESPQLRSFERAEQDEMIEIHVSINKDAPKNLGAVEIYVGKKFISPESKIETVSSSIEFTGYNLLNLDQAVKPRIATIIQTVRTKVLEELWNPPFALPHLMSALDDVLGLSVLEGQGRIEDGQVSWCLVYGAKGSEEKSAVEAAKN